MVRPLLSTLLWLATAAVSSPVLAATNQPPTDNGSKTVANSFIIEGKTSQDVESLVKTVEAAGGKVLEKFDSPFFYGLSVQGEMDVRALAAGFKVWEDEEIGLEIGDEAPKQAGQNEKKTSQPDAPQQHEARDTKGALWPNAITHVDKMHEAGFKGEGIKVAIVDTGVDYTHEALGGCFGKGCKVALGDNFASGGTPGDPKDCYGHGTAVAGMVAGSSSSGYLGVAPNATLLAYRVLDCKHSGTFGGLLKGWLRAAEDGAHIIVSSTGWEGAWADSAVSVAVARIAASGVVCVNSAGNSAAAGAFNVVSPGAGKDVLSVSTFSEKLVGDGYASLGPSWNLDVKPSLGAPGIDVPVLWLNNTYMKLSGTSYAAPFVAGVGALVAEALSTGGKGGAVPAKIDADAIRHRLMSTAKPQQASSGSGLASVIQQGGGLVDAWNAAHATTLVEPASLAFNDTEHRVPSLSLKITNTAEKEVTYNLSSLHAPTLNTIEFSYADPNPLQAERVDKAAADVKLSQDSLTLAPGKSATIKVTAADPTGLGFGEPPKLLIWSGWVVVNGTDGTNLSVPFLGAAGSLRYINSLADANPQLRIDGPDKEPVPADTEAFILKNPPSKGQLPGKPASIAQADAGKTVSQILVWTYIPFGSPEVRFDIVPLSICASSSAGENCVPGGNLTEFGGVKSIGQTTSSPMRYLGRHSANNDVTLRWDGSYKPGQGAAAAEVRYVPPGKYQLAVHVLDHFGDAANASHWRSYNTSEFSIAYEHNIKGKAAPTL
ncbi:subtilisin-like protease [Cordyceps fumosorosea ARSEF 2679]|uniref:Subtilisin-like protease n=1 Tax=Cordyceps fumosorosea (strain ARSEF 2679) TaxID=1081104 RepID=A0A167WJI5_CORFA|nr:subtilisin-like protease [Cordyceps fumosorosea ARSEF 2679]OAA63869.1 subtilisin-like protease [Cordyceps fumosorosea ARSEF 2679]